LIEKIFTAAARFLLLSVPCLFLQIPNLGAAMKISKRKKILIGAVAATLAPFMAAHAGNILGITYYTIAETDKDGNQLGSGTFDNEVQSHLGPNGLPVLNTTAFGCVSNCFSPDGAPTDVLSTGEITYWSPALNNGGSGGTSDVTQTGTGSVTLPFNVPFDFFPPNGTGGSDFNGFQAAVLSGSLTNASDEVISFSIGADDMAFAYLDGTIVCDLGGVHPATTGTCVTPFTIAAGTHTLDVFFVDINAVQSGFSFDISTRDVVTTPPTSTGPTVPEPATLALFGLGLFGIGAARNRVAKKAS